MWEYFHCIVNNGLLSQELKIRNVGLGALYGAHKPHRIVKNRRCCACLRTILFLKGPFKCYICADGHWAATHMPSVFMH